MHRASEIEARTKTCAVERAVMVGHVDDLQALDQACQRVYLGHEFCQRLLPSKADLVRAARQVSAQGRAITFVTPLVTDAGLRLAQDLVGALLALPGLKDPEIVVNDWGVLHWLHREHPSVPLALGRLLTKQKRGPQILRVMDKLPPPAIEHFRQSNVDAAHVCEHLRRLGVRRVELDNLLQGIRRDGGLPASLYYPYGYVTTTRLCLLMGGDRPGKNLRSIGLCSRECLRYDVTLRHADMPVPLLLKGNTQFFRNDRLPDKLSSLNIDRLVFIPAL